jgi:hypothetical protein
VGINNVSKSPNSVNRTAGTVAVLLELSIASIYEEASANTELYATMQLYAGKGVTEAPRREYVRWIRHVRSDLISKGMLDAAHIGDKRRLRSRKENREICLQKGETRTWRETD